MKKTLLFVATAVTALVSCEKNQEHANEYTTSEVKGIPMTLTANIGGTTKTSYADDGSGLKETWNAEEKISVITLDGECKMLAIDTFVSTGSAGRTSASFTGTFTGGATPAKVIAIYPALKVYAGPKYRTPAYKNYNGYNQYILYNGEIGGLYFDSTVHSVRQASDNDFAHLTNFCIMSGAVDVDDIKNNTLTVSLNNLMTIIKIVATFPESYKGTSLTQIYINCYNNSAESIGIFATNSWESVDQDSSPICGAGAAGSSTESIYSGFNVPESGVATLYMPVIIKSGNISSGDYWTFTANVNDKYLGPVTKTFTKDITIQRGKMYTANVTFTEP